MKKINVNDISWLRNDYSCSITVGNITYPSVEHAYQAAKFSDSKIKEKISGSTITEAKKIGRRTSGIVEDWDKIKIDIMRYLLRSKFCTNSRGFLAESLINTGNDEIEFNSKDSFWGTGSETGGNNVLGVLLKEIREELQFMAGWKNNKNENENDHRLADALGDWNLDLAEACQDLYNSIYDWENGKFSGDLHEAIEGALMKIDEILDEGDGLLEDEGEA